MMGKKEAPAMKDDKDPGTLDIFAPPTPIQRRRIMARVEVVCDFPNDEPV